MNRWFSGIALCCIFLIGFTSCKLLRHPAARQDVKDTVKISHAFIGPVYEEGNVNVAKKDSIATPVISNEKKMLMAQVMPLWQQQFSYSTFSGKARMHYEEKDNQNDFTAHIRIKKDSVIWINITALGGMVPVARILITVDSIKMINQIDREVMLLPLSQATRLLPVPADFSTLQNFIVGQALIKSGEIVDATDSTGMWTIKTEDSNYVQSLCYNKADSTLRSEQLHTHSPNSPQGFIEYKKYLLIRDRKFSFVRSVHLQNTGTSYTLEMDFNSADFDQELDFPFSIPASYTVNPRK